MRAFRGGERARQFDVEIVLVPGFLVDGLDLGKTIAEIRERPGHLFGVAAGGELGFFEQAEAAREVVDHFLTAGLKFHLATAGFLEGGAFALEFLLSSLQFRQLLLRFGDAGIHLFARGRTLEDPGAGRGSGSGRRFVRLEIAVHKIRWVKVGHAASLGRVLHAVKGCIGKISAAAACG
jgi:hypothetical protein